MFPLTYLATYFFKHNHNFDLEQNSIYKVLSSADFSEGKIPKLLFGRCFDIPSQAAASVFRGDEMRVEPFVQLGFWNSEGPRGQFISSLVYNHYIKFVASQQQLPETTLIDEDKPWLESAQEIVIAGLRNMKEEQFVEVNFVHYEDMIGASSGINVNRAFSNLYMIGQQTITTTTGGRGQKPTVDWYFNGRLKLAVELVRMRTRYPLPSATITALNNHFAKFEGGEYSEWNERYVILHFQMTGKELLFPTLRVVEKVKEKGKEKGKEKELNHQLFTFVYQTNTLYHGGEVVKRNVVRYLRTPRTN